MQEFEKNIENQNLERSDDMNILITAGGTTEKIDDVRYITNHATGSLGKKIAEICLSNPKIDVYYVYGQQAVLPEPNERLHLLPIHSVNDLKKQLEALLTTKTFFAVIHSMAVSDYFVKKSFSETNLVEAITTAFEKSGSLENITEVVQTALASIKKTSDKKISSAEKHLYIELDKAPKVISFIKKWQPSVKLVGFKLLVDVPQSKLVDVAYEQLQKNHCDYVLANDLTTIHSDTHIGLLVDSHKNFKTYSTKNEIAHGILAHLFTQEKSPGL